MGDKIHEIEQSDALSVALRRAKTPNEKAAVISGAMAANREVVHPDGNIEYSIDLANHALENIRKRAKEGTLPEGNLPLEEATSYTDGYLAVLKKQTGNK